MSNKSSPSHPPYSEMVDCALHSGKGEKISRKKIYEYIAEVYKVQIAGNDNSKDRFKKAMDKRISDGLVVQEKQSFEFTAAGEKYYKDTYESTSEEEDEDEAPKAAGKKTEK
ncbi:hypothetical protein Rhopal_007224-T1 [Rhodotorula paludigena]|uniref:Histone H1 n=1 Tax=Rhodotorula paludigena TaxID=86838 RepID=A0AAV5GW23_9BASI|nr:hypothetical protein Rhopal_007224-T1 [Rhodotorula paludigena]